MPLDFTDPRVINLFYQKSLAAGKKQSEIDAYVKQQQAFAAQSNAGQAAQAGILNPQQALQYGGAGVLPALLKQQQQGGVPQTPGGFKDLAAAQQDQMIGRQQLLDSSQKALSALDTTYQGKDVTGATQSIGRKFRESWGLVSKESVEYQALLSAVAAARAFALGGKQFTGFEKQIIAPALPETSDDEEVIRGKLQSLIAITKGDHEAAKKYLESVGIKIPSLQGQTTTDSDPQDWKQKVNQILNL